MEDIGIKIRENGWKQGCLFPAARFSDQFPDLARDDTCHLLVVSQSCDLVHHSLENEPLAVFLVTRRVDAIRPAHANGLHPRQIDFAATGEIAISASAWEQISVDRTFLAEHDINDAPIVAEPQLRVVLNWLGKRYTRTAFPDGFNDQLRKASAKIKGALKKKQHLFSDVLLSVQPFRELNQGEHYQVVLNLMMDESAYNDEEALNQADTVAKRIRSIMEASGIEVVQCEAVSETELTLADFKLMQRWDYDYLTYREELAN